MTAVPLRYRVATVAMAFIFAAGPPVILQEQTPPAAAATASPGPDEHPETGEFDPAKLTPEQREELQLAIVKISQNPVGNITVFPFQNNFNYGYGPYTRLQYNLNVQPVFPVMLSRNWNL